MVKYFLGANTGNGFYSLFDELYVSSDKGRLYVIKGGPGTGKSSVMKEIANEAEKRGYEVERIYCSSDPDSLDAVIIPELKTSIADGTPPHTIEPKYPGAVEQIVNLGDFWDAGYLQSKAENIKEKGFECSSYHKSSVRFLKAYSSMINDNKRIVSNCIDSEKLTDFAHRFALREFKEKGKKGSVKRRFLSAVTPKGITLFDETVKQLCDRVICIDDEYGIVSNILLTFLGKTALANGYDTVVCPCITDPKRKIDHLIIPEKRLCIFTENNCHKLDGDVSKTVSAKRFLNTAELKKHSARLSFNHRASAEMLDEAVLSLANAKAVHDELEKYYIEAMDFDLVKEKTHSLINEIFD